MANGWESRLWRLEDKHLREGSSVRQFGRPRPLRIRHRRRRRRRSFIAFYFTFGLGVIMVTFCEWKIFTLIKALARDFQKLFVNLFDIL